MYSTDERWNVSYDPEVILEYSPVGLIKVDRDFKIEVINPAAKNITGNRLNRKGLDLRIIPLIADSEPGDFFEKLAEGKEASFEAPFFISERNKEKNASLALEGKPVISGDDFCGAVITVRDITRKKEAEHHVEQLQRISVCITEILKTIVGESDKTRLFYRTCRALADSRMYRFAWVGLIRQSRGVIFPFAAAGEDYNDSEVFAFVNRRNCFSLVPAENAIESRRPFLFHSFEEIEDEEPEMPGHIEFASGVAIPILHSGQVYGVLVIYSAFRDAFDSEEIELLASLTESLALV